MEILGSGGAATIPRPGCRCRVCVEARAVGGRTQVWFDVHVRVKASLRSHDNIRAFHVAPTNAKKPWFLSMLVV